MKYFITLSLHFVVFTTKAQTINNPQSEFTNTGIYHISNIILADTATIVELKISFLPNWWTTLSNKAYLEKGK